MSTEVTAIVLAGGRARRFGGPKLSALVDGRPLLQLAIEAAAAVATDAVVVVGPGSTPDIPEVGVPLQVVHDREPDAGPLAALAEGLRAAGSVAIVVGGDMPRLSPIVLRLMLQRVELGAVAVVLAEPATAPSPIREPRVPRQTLPLAVRVDAARLAADAALASGRRALQALLDRLDVTEIAGSEWLPLDPDAATLLDVDEPGDLERGPLGRRSDDRAG